MKKSKSFTEVETAELPKLPDSWEWTKLGEIAHVTSGNTPKYLKKAENKGQFPFYKVSDMNSEGNETWMKTSNLYLTNDEKVLFKIKEEQKGTIIFPKRGGAILTNKKRRLSCNAAYDLNIMGVKETSKHVLNDFLWYWFSKLDLRKLYDGSNVPQINNKNIEPLFFPLSPLPEQRAIVSKIEQLLSELDNGISNLKLAQEQLKVYRQAVLKKAFEGELTKKWREQQKDLPDAEDLLEHIRRKRKESYSKELEKWEDAGSKGKKSTKPNKSKEIEPITEIELAELPNLPKDWAIARMGQLSTKVVDGVHKKPNYVSSGIPFVTVKNLTAGKGIDFENLNYISEEDHQEFCKRANPELGDILITKDGTLGVVRVIKTKKAFSIFVSVAMMKPIKTCLNSDYLCYFIESPFGQRQTKKIGKGSGLKHLHLEDLRKMIFFLPSLPEQQAIVQEIETRLSICDKIEQDIEKNLEKAEALRQSILKKAFEGKLLNEKELAEVRGAEDWEPAEVLLERIKAEKARNEKKGKQETEKLKSIIQEDKEIIQQATLQAFERIDK